jgi:2-C-methyl-D-erythritol 2,4-cyclodiphosphate synthase
VIELRVGTGVDAHAFADGVPLVLGGVRIDHPRGLAGHSDGDVLAHALTDAVLGAAGLEDIGALFPSGDAALAGADSVELLREAWRRVREHGWELANADVVLVGE